MSVGALARMAPALLGVPVALSGEKHRAGKVEGWLNSPELGPQLLVRSGWWNPVLRRVPADRVVSAGPQGVQLDLDREAFRELPRHLPDSELEEAVRVSLESFPPFRNLGAGMIQIRARDGVVELAGHLPYDSHRRRALSLAAATPGVVRVEDALVTDEQLVQELALAMRAHPQLQPSRVRISADWGRVLLEGELDSPADVELALQLAASIPGVEAVESRLQVATEVKPALPPPAPQTMGRLVMLVEGRRRCA